MSTIPKEEYKQGEIVWHYGFKMKVKFVGVSQPVRKYLWYIVQLPNGGIHETQKIEKLTNQDIEYFKK